MVAAVVVDVDCNVHLAVHHRTVDTDLVRQIVDFAVDLVETVNPVDKVAVVQPDTVVLLQDLLQLKCIEKNDFIKFDVNGAEKTNAMKMWYVPNLPVTVGCGG